MISNFIALASGAGISGLAIRSGFVSCMLAAVLAMTATTIAQAQSAPIIYPSQGQSLDQQAGDEAACGSWAQQQTGFHPSQGPSYSGGQATGGEVVGGAARGALLGVVGGAIGGDVGKGAAIGAGVGATAGLMRRHQKNRANQEQQDQARAQYNQQLDAYNRSFGACMQGRGYAVN